MTIDTHTHAPASRPLRLWPGVLVVVLQLLLFVGAPLVIPDGGGIAVIGGAIGGMVILVWWLFFSRAPWIERIGALVVMVVAVFVTKSIVHASIANGMMGMMLPVLSIPVLSLALVLWAVATRSLSSGPRRALMVVVILLACGMFTLVRTGGINGAAMSDLHWRWTPTPEQRLLAQATDDPVAPPAGARTGRPDGRRIPRRRRQHGRVTDPVGFDGREDSPKACHHR